MELALTQTGAAPLIKITVNPFVRENLSVRGSMVRVNLTDGSRRILSNSRLRLNHLVALDSTSNRKFQTAVKDHNGLWTEWTDETQTSFSNFSPGATQASIGSAATVEKEIEEPGVLFPSLEIGSSKLHVFKTMVGTGFTDEERREMASDARAVFTVYLHNLDDESRTDGSPTETAQLLHRWFKSLNGAFKPFLFDFKDPAREDDVLLAEVRYIVRFREPELAEDMFAGNLSNFHFTLVECTDFHKGGDV